MTSCAPDSWRLSGGGSSPAVKAAEGIDDEDDSWWSPGGGRAAAGDAVRRRRRARLGVRSEPALGRGPRDAGRPCRWTAGADERHGDGPARARRRHDRRLARRRWTDVDLRAGREPARGPPRSRPPSAATDLTRVIAPIRWSDDRLLLLDQTRLPGEELTREYRRWEDVAEAIRTLVVRGAPAIGVTAAFGVALAARQSRAESFDDLLADLDGALKGLAATR